MDNKVIRVRVCNVCEEIDCTEHRDTRLAYLDVLCREVYGTSLEAELCCSSLVSKEIVLPEHQQPKSKARAKDYDSVPYGSVTGSRDD